MGSVRLTNLTNLAVQTLALLVAITLRNSALAVSILSLALSVYAMVLANKALDHAKTAYSVVVKPDPVGGPHEGKVVDE